MFEEFVLADIAAIGAEIEQIDATAKINAPKSPRARAVRQPLPDHLPRIVYTHTADEYGDERRIWLIPRRAVQSRLHLF